MAKLTFPSVITKAYAGFVSEVRNQLVIWKSKTERNPGASLELRRQLNVLLVALGGGAVDGTDVTVKNSAGTKTVVGDAVYNEATGVLTQVDLPATAAMITSAQALTGVTPTGTFITTVTFTVAGGVITAIVLS